MNDTEICITTVSLYYRLLHLYGNILCCTNSVGRIPPKEAVPTQYFPYSCNNHFNVQIIKFLLILLVMHNPDKPIRNVMTIRMAYGSMCSESRSMLH